MPNDRERLIDALEYALSALAELRKQADDDAKANSIGAGTTLLTQPNPTQEMYKLVSDALEQCSAFQEVAGAVLFSANSGLVELVPVGWTGWQRS